MGLIENPQRRAKGGGCFRVVGVRELLRFLEEWMRGWLPSIRMDTQEMLGLYVYACPL